MAGLPHDEWAKATIADFKAGNAPTRVELDAERVVAIREAVKGCRVSQRDLGKLVKLLELRDPPEGRVHSGDQVVYNKIVALTGAETSFDVLLTTVVGGAPVLPSAQLAPARQIIKPKCKAPGETIDGSKAKKLEAEVKKQKATIETLQAKLETRGKDLKAAKSAAKKATAAAKESKKRQREVEEKTPSATSDRASVRKKQRVDKEVAEGREEATASRRRAAKGTITEKANKKLRAQLEKRGEELAAAKAARDRWEIAFADLESRSINLAFSLEEMNLWGKPVPVQGRRGVR
jgi:hypothetical protein